MKSIINKSLIFLIASFLLISCGKLTDVNNVKPVNQLSEDEAITTVAQAQSILYGAYGLVKGGLEVAAYNSGLTSVRGLTMIPGSSGGALVAEFQNNEVTPENFYVDVVYTKFYKIINNVNHIIEKAPLINTQDPRRNQIVGEARFLRALSHFYLLRLHGYFFDVSSKYGIVIKDKPIAGAISEPRATVQASYDFINDDLDYAIANCPSFTNTFYASSQAAMGLKAKVLLYEKKYGEAAVLAKQVILSNKFQLETSFQDIFVKKIVGTKEVLFQTPYDDKNDRNNKAYIFRSSYLPSPHYINILTGDNRKAWAIGGSLTAPRNSKFNNTIFNGQTLTADTEYFLRLDEIYLILAEAIVRSNGVLSDATDAIDKIRNRAVMPNTTAITKPQILEAIRVEKILELGAESGEEWYDLVRFAKIGDLVMTNFKPGAVSEQKYVLPLPYATVNLSNNVVEQNPGY